MRIGLGLASKMNLEAMEIILSANVTSYPSVVSSWLEMRNQILLFFP
jgi:hypothetical protein